MNHSPLTDLLQINHNNGIRNLQMQISSITTNQLVIQLLKRGRLVGHNKEGKHSPLTDTIANQSSQHKISYLPHASILKISRISTRASNNEFWSKENSCFFKHVIINNTCLKV